MPYCKQERIHLSEYLGIFARKVLFSGLLSGFLKIPYALILRLFRIVYEGNTEKESAYMVLHYQTEEQQSDKFQNLSNK